MKTERIVRYLFLAVALCAAPAALFAQPQKTIPEIGLANLSDAIESLSQKVSGSVVKVLSTGFGADEDPARKSAGMVSNQRSLGSGVLLSADGYIVTNAHVVRSARRIQVHLSNSKSAHGLYDAKLIGADSQTDLALIKIEETNLPFLTLADSSAVKQGQFVLAFGNPLGLENSVSFGIVSAVARRVGTDDPRVYIQTDAAINPGNSGGPLVDVNGSVVGLNTFILTESGGNEGVGFAIPSDVVRYIVGELRAEGHVHRAEFGMTAREITPALAEGLHLPQETGILVDDAAPDGPAKKAGVNAGDILLDMDGKPLSDLSQLSTMLYHYKSGDTVKVDLLRGTDKMSVRIVVDNRSDDPERFADMATRQEDLIGRIGILALSLNDELRSLLPPLRIDSGVVVAALAGTSSYLGDDIEPGDIIHSIDGKSVADVASLRAELDSLKTDDPIVLQVERSGSLTYLVLERN